MEIIDTKGFTVIGIKVQAKWDDLHEKMPKVWQEFRKRLEEVSERKNDIMMDISLDESDGVYTQLIGVEVEGDTEIPDGMTKIIIPSQKYVYYEHEGDVSKIAESFGKMYDWAEQQNIDVGDFKIDVGYRRDSSDRAHELYVKVV
ncbi:GyrI-like domain-containing protein [Fodinibius sp. Rm-B-1B1-1]|uniref:GyrI-like domain-containing protein n=1 Tax=Fodinibius alkaliphilus TaxID=3140241 RepID=UPI00315A11ED